MGGVCEDMAKLGKIWEMKQVPRLSTGFLYGFARIFSADWACFFGWWENEDDVGGSCLLRAMFF
jgi:hypothetical protein